MARWTWTRTKNKEWTPGPKSYHQKDIDMHEVMKRASEWRDKALRLEELFGDGVVSPEAPDVMVYWLENPFDNPVYGEVSFNRRMGTEALARAEAARLGFDVVVIRAELHDKRNQYDAYGIIKMKNDLRSGRIDNDVADADWHLTVLMGYDVQNLVIHGHIYITWNSDAMYGMRMVKDKSERKHVPSNEEAGLTAYWSLYQATGAVPSSFPLGCFTKRIEPA